MNDRSGKDSADKEAYSPRVLEVAELPDYKILSRLGSGTYGDVWLAETVTGTLCALKAVFRERFSSSEPYDQEFRGIQNAIELSRSTGPLVTIYHVGLNKEADYFYYAMELADANPHVPAPSNPNERIPYTIQSILDAKIQPNLQEIISIGKRTLTGLAHMHLEGFVHRDIKPSNIIFIEGQAKIADVGLVAPLSTTSTICGTHGYIPVTGRGTPGADLYAVGKILYELATGCDRMDFPRLPTTLPYQGDTETFKRLNDLILKACDERIASRYSSAREMFEDLSRLDDKKQESGAPSTQWWCSFWTDSGPPQPLEESRVESVTGAVPLDSRLYLTRSADLDFQTSIDRTDAIILIKGARQIGKTSLLARGLHQARNQGFRTVSTDLQTFSNQDLATPSAFFCALADDLVDQLEIDSKLSEQWSELRSPNRNFERFLRREILNTEGSTLFWGWDEVDRLFAVPFGTEVFSLLRACYNKRALDPVGPWKRLSITLTYASEAQSFITDANQSPFNVGTRIVLSDFDRNQISNLNRLHGTPLNTEEDCEHFYEYFGGQPFLSRLGFYEIITRGLTNEALLIRAEDADGPFSEHLSRLVNRINEAGKLDAALNAAFNDEAIEQQDDFLRLRSLGVLRGESRKSARFRCELYRQFLRRHLQ